MAGVQLLAPGETAPIFFCTVMGIRKGGRRILETRELEIFSIFVAVLKENASPSHYCHLLSTEVLHVTPDLRSIQPAVKEDNTLNRGIKKAC